MNSWRVAVLAFGMLRQAAVLAADAPAAPSHPAFDVSEYRVLGNSQLPIREIETVLYPRLGPNKTFEDVEGARAALERRYHDLGYGAVFVDIPEQQVEDGLIRLHVTEGRLDRVRVTGARFYSNRALLAQLPATSGPGSPNFQQLQQQLAQVNAQTADYRVVPVLRAGETPGTVDLDLKVEDRLPLHASLELDNRYTVDSRPLRATGSVSYDNLWDRGDSASFQYQTAPQLPSSVKVWSGTYLLRFAADAPVLSMYAISTNSNVTTLGALSVLGAGNIYGARLTLPLLSASESQSIAFGFDYKKFRDNVQVTSTQGVSDEVNYLNLAGQYTLSASDTHGSTSLLASANFGLRPATPMEQNFDDKRFDARPNYFVLHASAARTQKLPLGFSGYIEADGQMSAEPLISNEEYSAGGASSVRGYYEAEELGDEGFHGTVELRSPMVAPLPFLRASYLFGFFDWATLAVHDPLPGQANGATLDSTGVGFRVGPYDHFESGIDWAYPLRDGANTLRGQGRVDFYLRYAE